MHPYSRAAVPMSRYSDRTVALIAYVLHLVGSVAAIPSLIGLVLNYMSRRGYDDALASHHRYMIKTFWWTVLWMIVGWVLTLLLVGWIVCFLAWAWYIYRHIRGLIALSNAESLPA
jgi:uncharacterized membrane protein